MVGARALSSLCRCSGAARPPGRRRLYSAGGGAASRGASLHLHGKSRRAGTLNGALTSLPDDIRRIPAHSPRILGVFTRALASASGAYNEAKVSDIKAKIANGTYSIDPEQIASRMIDQSA